MMFVMMIVSLVAGALTWVTVFGAVYWWFMRQEGRRIDR